ncbi:thioredoxin family protein [Moheibacter stercoris]|uniref:Thioredoxin n=1 Tax=Moheibacter stercoris TaxID=1628251 RepID=A0ABV2LW22_9FLAO
MNLQTYVNKEISYSEYLDVVKAQMNQMKEEGDPKDYVQYYFLGLTRMERWNKTFELSTDQKEVLKSIQTDFEFLSISEGWCGDASQILPIVDKIAIELGVNHRIVFRDENPELMDAYLTDGAKSIPMIIGVKSDGSEKFHFGPRPSAGMEFLYKHKQDPESYTTQDFHKDLHQYYTQNKGMDIFNELIAKIQNS